MQTGERTFSFFLVREQFVIQNLGLYLFRFLLEVQASAAGSPTPNSAPITHDIVGIVTWLFGGVLAILGAWKLIEEIGKIRRERIKSKKDLRKDARLVKPATLEEMRSEIDAFEGLRRRKPGDPWIDSLGGPNIWIIISLIALTAIILLYWLLFAR
jgi:hypothetical protein